MAVPATGRTVPGRRVPGVPESLALITPTPVILLGVFKDSAGIKPVIRAPGMAVAATGGTVPGRRVPGVPESLALITPTPVSLGCSCVRPGTVTDRIIGASGVAVVAAGRTRARGRVPTVNHSLTFIAPLPAVLIPITHALFPFNLPRPCREGCQCGERSRIKRADRRNQSTPDHQKTKCPIDGAMSTPLRPATG
jgi:hypothetical protein